MAKAIVAIGIIIVIFTGAYFSGMLNYNTISSISPMLSSPINKIVNETLGKTTEIIPNNLQNSPKNFKTASYDNSLWPCSLKSDNVGKIDINCYTNGLYHFNNKAIVNLNIDEVRLVWNSDGNYQALYQKSSDEKEYDLGSLVSMGNTNTPQPSTPAPVSIPKISIPVISNNPPPVQPLDLVSLYAYALKIINDDRKAHGLNPVALSNIRSAQYHADDQLRIQYFSHWNSDGVKPYVVYTKLGGKGLVAENDYYKYSFCPTSNCVENTYDPYAEIKNGENEMMTNDEASHWGHRDNIIDPHHTHVNFGIAYDDERFYFVENFENNIINWQSLQLANNRLHLLGTIPAGYSISQISIFSDSIPKILSGTDLNTVSPYNLGYYDQGTLVGDIVPMPQGNSRYVECTPGKISLDTERGKDCVDYVTFINSSNMPNGIDIYVDVSKWSGTGGLHTFYLSLKDQNNNEVEATSLTLEYLK